MTTPAALDLDATTKDGDTPMENDEPTLYDWLMQIDGMEEGIAVDIDDRVPEIERIPTPQTLDRKSVV